MRVTQSSPIDQDRKIALLSQQPCFASLSFHELDSLASLLIIKSISAKQIIVKQGTVVDSVYFIWKGSAEVQREVITENKKEMIPIATLNETEAIGLNELGFYSVSGLRTATVVALTDCILLRLDLSLFNEFAAEHESVNHKMQLQAEIMLRMKLIKSAVPFARLNASALHTLSEQVSKRMIKPGEIVFNKGEPGDSCYLIESGKIEIFSPTDGVIAVLKAPAVFGEGSILSGLPRSASARATKKTELIVLDRNMILELLKKEKNISLSLNLLSRNRARPKRFPYIEVHKDATDSVETQIILKDPKHHEYYRLSPEGYFIWQKLDGQHTLRDIVLEFHREFDVFDPGMIAEFVMDLEEDHFVEKSFLIEKPGPKTGWVRFLAMVKRVAEAALSFERVDEILTKTYKKVIFLFFTWPAQLVMLSIVVTGIIFFTMGYRHQIEFLQTIRFYQSFSLVLGAFVVSMFTIFLHELAHAYTTKRFGHQVKCFGVGWYWLGPVAFCDTSDMWLTTKWPRLAVDVAGMYMDLLTAGIAAIFAYISQHEAVSFFLWFIALSNYLGVFANLSPIIELDGYYALMDLLGRANLREEAVEWLVYDMPGSFRHPERLLKYKVEVFYWFFCIFYLCLKVVVAYWVMNILLYGLFGIRNLYLTLLPSLIVLIVSSVTVWGEIQAKKQRRH